MTPELLKIVAEMRNASDLRELFRLAIEISMTQQQLQGLKDLLDDIYGSSCSDPSFDDNRTLKKKWAAKLEELIKEEQCPQGSLKVTSDSPVISNSMGSSERPESVPSVTG